MPSPLFRRRTHLPFLLELLASAFARVLYRVRSSGQENFPAVGGVLLITNHISYADVIAIQLACPRPLRFIGYKGLQKNPFFEWAFKITGSIGISATQPREGMRLAAQALKRGEAVCICPEGQISRTGQLMEIKRGFEVIARQAQAPVIAAAIDGLWDSIFSFSGNKFIWKLPRIKRTPVFIAFGPPATAEQASTTWARRELLDLGEQAFNERPLLKRHLGRECVRTLTRHPRRTFIIDRTLARQVLSCGQLFAAAAVLARHLRRHVNEPRIGIVLPPGAGAFIANLGVICAGKIPVNLNFTAGRAASEASLVIGGISTVISADVLRAKIASFPWPARTLDLKTELTKAGGKRAMLPWLLAAWFLPNQWCANLLRIPKTGDRTEAGLLFTSGSSGEPKGVALTHRNILANCTQISSLSILPETCVLLACLPVFHSFGFTVTLWYPMLRSCQIITVPSPLDTRKIIDAICEEQATVMLGTPTFIRPLLKKALPSELRSLDLIVTGAEKLPEELRHAFHERFHLDILQGYGLTETTPAANLNQPHPRAVFASNDPQIGHWTGSVGRMMPGMTARIVDPDTKKPLALTETGLVLFRGANVFTGYLDQPAKTAAAFHDGWFISGDLGRFNDDGFLFIEGRLSRFSKIAGEMVPHGTIEQTILEAFAWQLQESPPIFIAGIPDATKGEALVLLCTQEISPEQLRQKLSTAGVSNLWIPKHIVHVDAIPMLGTGKTDLKKCLDLALAATAPLPPATTASS